MRNLYIAIILLIAASEQNRYPCHHRISPIMIPRITSSILNILRDILCFSSPDDRSFLSSGIICNCSDTFTEQWVLNSYYYFNFLLYSAVTVCSCINLSYYLFKLYYTNSSVSICFIFCFQIVLISLLLSLI